VLGCMGIASMLVPILWTQYQFFKIPGRLHRIEMKRSLSTLVIVAGLLLFALAVPLPHHVTCSFTIQPQDGQALYVKHDAILKAVHVLPGQRVMKGELVAELENVDTLLKLAKFKADSDEIRNELRLLEKNRKATIEETKRINELRESLKTNEESRQSYEEIVVSFHMVAPKDGRVIPERAKRQRENGIELGTWDGSPLAPENLGTSFKSGDKLCVIGDLNRWEAVMVVNEHDIRFLNEGQFVKLLIDSQASHRMDSKVESIARKESEHVPGSLSQSYGGSIQLQTRAQTLEGDPRPADEHFEVKALLPESDFPLSSGLRGTAQIRVGSKTLYSRCILYFYRLFQKAF
jgi:putative peptide zinc metalloprotease protein